MSTQNTHENPCYPPQNPSKCPPEEIRALIRAINLVGLATRLMPINPNATLAQRAFCRQCNLHSLSFPSDKPTPNFTTLPHQIPPRHPRPPPPRHPRVPLLPLLHSLLRLAHRNARRTSIQRSAAFLHLPRVFCNNVCTRDRADHRRFQTPLTGV